MAIISQDHSLLWFVIPAPHNLLIHVIHSLLDVFGGEVQVSVVDPLNFEPILEVVVSTAAKLHLQTIDGLFLKTAARHVCVLVEANTIPQAHLTVGRERSGLFYLMFLWSCWNWFYLNAVWFVNFGIIWRDWSQSSNLSLYCWLNIFCECFLFT